MNYDDMPAVLFDSDLATALRTSERTVKRLRVTNALPIPMLPSIDRRKRYSREDVIRFLERRQDAPRRPRG